MTEEGERFIEGVWAIFGHGSVAGVGEALRFVPGVTVAQGEGHRDAPVLRGNATTADFFVDGVRDDLQYFRRLQYRPDRSAEGAVWPRIRTRDGRRGDQPRHETGGR
jgi:hypothetical protein